jgi:hypothetical protein
LVQYYNLYDGWEHIKWHYILFHDKDICETHIKVATGIRIVVYYVNRRMHQGIDEK